MRITKLIEPGSVVKTGRVNDECASVPFANRVSEPSRVRILGKFSPVRPDFAPCVIPLEELQHPARNLNDLDRCGGIKQNAWDTQGITDHHGVISKRLLS